MKLSINKFRNKNTCLVKRKRDKIPTQCFDCSSLKSFTNKIGFYYYCSEANEKLNKLRGK